MSSDALTSQTDPGKKIYLAANVENCHFPKSNVEIVLNLYSNPEKANTKMLLHAQYANSINVFENL